MSKGVSVRNLSMGDEKIRPAICFGDAESWNLPADHCQWRRGLIVANLNEGQLIKIRQIELCVSLKRLCLVYRDLVRRNQPVKLVNFNEWNPVMESMFSLYVVRCQVVEEEACGNKRGDKLRGLVDKLI